MASTSPVAFLGPYEIRDNENADGITELDNKNGINW